MTFFFWRLARADFGAGNFALQHLATFGSSREVFVMKAIVQIFVRVTKLAWFDHPCKSIFFSLTRCNSASPKMQPTRKLWRISQSFCRFFFIFLSLLALSVLFTSIQASVDHCVVGMTILAELVQEMNTNLTNQTITKHRKASIAFRDLSLLRIFQISLSTLRQMVDRAIPFQNRENSP